MGQHIKDYPTLCAVSNLKQVTGKSKQLQMKKLEKYVKLKNLKRGYIVEEIIGYPNPVLSNPAKSPYIKLIETLIMAQLVNNKSQSIETTYRQLFYTLYMTSSNYNDIYKKQSYDYIFKNIAPISKEVYMEFRRYSYSEIKRKIKSTLDSMKKRSLIDYQEEMYVCCVDEDGVRVHRKLSKKEVDEYLKISRSLLEKYGCNDISQLDKKHMRKKYEKDLRREVKNQLGWKYEYEKLIIMKANIDSMQILNDTKNDFMKNEVETSKIELNHVIKKMINKVGENNHINAIKKLKGLEKDDEDWGDVSQASCNIEGNEEAARNKAKNFI